MAVDVNMSTIYPTTYQAKIFYPPYFAATTRPIPTGMPQNLSYGGAPFDITILSSSYSGSANSTADNLTVMLMCPGFTTHAMNMGQCTLQLNNTYTVNQKGSIVLHVSQAPPNPNILQPGPMLMFVIVNGIPSNGTMVIVGNRQVGTQPMAAVQLLSLSIHVNSTLGSASSTMTTTTTTMGSTLSASLSSTSHTGIMIGVIVLVSIVCIGLCKLHNDDDDGQHAECLVEFDVAHQCCDRCNRARQHCRCTDWDLRDVAVARSTPAAHAECSVVRCGDCLILNSDLSVFVLLLQTNDSMAWNNASTMSLTAPTPHRDYNGGRGMPSGKFDPYYKRMPQQQHVAQ